jgi:uncharacterized Zn finger protein
LFPNNPDQFDAACSCPDYANLCKHIAAVYYLLGEQFDADPFLIFALRGRTREQIIDALRIRRAQSVGPAAGTPSQVIEREIAPTLQEQLTKFWQLSASDELLPAAHIAPPDVSLAILRRLGTSPAGTKEALRFEEFLTDDDPSPEQRNAEIQL